MKTLDQERAAFAWKKVKEQSSKTGYKDFCNLAKSAPALVISNGLMQTLAFYKGKGKGHHTALWQIIGAWLKAQKIVNCNEADFKNIMDELSKMKSQRYQLATEESLAILKWLRYLADTLKERS